MKVAKNSSSGKFSTIAQINVEVCEDGSSKFWLNCVGWHASQGGREPGVASYGFNSLEDLLKYYVNVVAKDEQDLLDCCKIVYSS